MKHLLLLATLGQMACGTAPAEDTFAGLPVDRAAFAEVKRLVAEGTHAEVPPMHYVLVAGDGADLGFTDAAGNRVDGTMDYDSSTITVVMGPDAQACPEQRVPTDRLGSTALAHEMIHAAIGDEEHQRASLWYGSDEALANEIVHGFGCPSR